MLKNYSKGDTNVSYTYDSNGVRLSKTVNDVLHSYFINGTTIYSEKIGNEVYTYLYDATGIAGIRHNGKYYYFLKTQQGDVKYIADADGILQAEYVYDAWGNCKILVNGVDITDNSEYNTHIANINPFRYRGYYFDTETGLYYLNSRYYDPQTRRFVNADDPSIPVLEQATDIGGLNLYSYCLNNPVNMADPNGHLALTIGLLMLIGFGVGSVIGAASSVISQFVGNGFTFEGFNWWQFALDTVLGGVGGMLSVSPLGAGAMIAANTAVSFVGSVGGHLINGSDFAHYSTWIDIGLSIALGALIGKWGGEGGLNAGYLNGAKRTAGFLKSVNMYDEVLTKSINGFYRTTGIARNALRLSHNNVMKHWNKMIVTQAGAALRTSLTRTGIALSTGSLFKGMVYYYTS